MACFWDGALVMDDEIKREFDRLWSVVNRMDDQGTRGVVTVQVQITELIKDFGEFKVEMHTRLTSAVQARRWLIGLVVGMLGMIGGLIDVAIQMRK